ncbi:Protein of unknown function [Lactobacillus delbrueckii subsp. lactis]|nr:Protein of unknown function [Lactobacillus delbrueckii subsp. lactis]
MEILPKMVPRLMPE